MNASAGSSIAEQPTHYPQFKGLNPPASCPVREKKEKKSFKNRIKSLKKRFSFVVAASQVDFARPIL